MTEKDHLEDSYYKRYRDLFETSGIDNKLYMYYVELVNINENTEWPLDKCPNCSTDLTENPPEKKYFELSSTTAKSIAVILTIGIFTYLIFRFTSIISALSNNSFVGVFALLIIIAFSILLIKAGKKTGRIQLFYCPECKALLFNKVVQHPMTTKMHPNVFFAELEKLGKFRFKP